MAGEARREGMRLKLIGLAYLLVWGLARALPERLARKLFDWSSGRSYRRNTRRREVVRDNLLPVVGPGPQLDRTIHEAFNSYGRYWMETLAEIHAQGRGGVLATPHLGNWDTGGRWVAERWPLTVVVEVLRPKMLFDRFVEHRRGLGMTIIPLVRGGDATARCLEKIREGGYVALVSDRDLSGRGVEVKMFGRTTKMPPGPAVLALRAGVPLIPACIYQLPDGDWHAWVMDPIDGGVTGETPENVALLTQRMAEAYERLIAREPAQWHAFSPMWLPAGRPAEAPPGGAPA